MANEQYTSPNMSRSEEIVQATIDGTEYNKPSQSRLETLLIELKEAVESGGGESSDYATALSLTIDSSTYIITARLLNKDGDTLGTAQTIDLPLESVVVSGYYNSATKKVVLTLQSGSTIEFSVADLVSGLQTEITSTNKLNADLVDDSTSTNKFVTSAEKTAWNNKQNVLTVGTNLDDEPIEDSTNPITSGGVYNTVGNLDAALDSLIMSLEPKTITANGTYDPADDGVDGYSEVTVNVGGTSVSKKDVTFYDYDSTVVASYTAAEFAELTALPENPAHEGLTAQGWNWSLAEAKTYVASYGKLNIGQMYITSDGKTRLYIELTEGRLKPYLGLTGNSSGTAVSIDWGDNSTAESVTLDANTIYTPHEYAAVGEYIIAITVTTGSITFTGNNANGSNIFKKSASPNSNADKVYQNILTKLEIGSSVTTISGNAFYYCYSLTSLIIPNSVTTISDSAFYHCYSLTSLIIPNSVTFISGSAFYQCYSLTSLIIPNSVTTIGGNAFKECFSLTSVTIPNSVTTIGGNAFQECFSLTSVTIPNSVTSIGAFAFYHCYGLGFIKFHRTTPATIGSDAFNSIPTDCIIYVPTGSLSAYTSASGYPSSSTYTYVEY